MRYAVISVLFIASKYREHISIVVKDSVGVSGSMWAAPAPQLGMLLRICVYSKNSTTTLSESTTKYLRKPEFLADYNISICVLPESHRVGYIYCWANWWSLWGI